MIDSCHGLRLGHGSRVMRVTGQLNDGPRGSRVTKYDHCQLCGVGLYVTFYWRIQTLADYRSIYWHSL